MTNSHSTARKPNRMTVRVSSDIAPASPFGLPVNDGGTAHDDPRAVAETSASGVLPVHHDAVGGTQILDRGGRSDPDLTVTPGHTRVVDPHVGVGAAAQHQRRTRDLVTGAVDLDPAPGLRIGLRPCAGRCRTGYGRRPAGTTGRGPGGRPHIAAAAPGPTGRPGGAP